MSSQLAAVIWESNRIRDARKKLFYEFAVFILGMGNPMFLILFWPGWILVAAALATWKLCG